MSWESQRPLRRGQVWTHREGPETAVYNPATGALHLLNASALAIWELCDGDTAGIEMAEAVAELTQADPEQARRDVRTALEELAKLDLISMVQKHAED